MGAEEHVLLCFYLQKAFLDDTTSLPQMTYSAILNDSEIEAGRSILSESGSQVWLKKNKVIWNMPRRVYDELVKSEVSLHIKVRWDEDSSVSANVVSEFSVPIPCVEDSIDWDNLFETVTNGYHFHFHIHVQPNFAVYSEYNQSTINQVIHLTSSESSLNAAAEDYTLTIIIDCFENGSEFAQYLQRTHLSSEAYILKATFDKEYQTQLTSFEGSSLLSFDPIHFHSPIHLISSYFQFVEPPTIQLTTHSGLVICSFILDLEQFGLNLACCPSDENVQGSCIQLNNTMQIRDILDCTQFCPAVFTDYTCDVASLRMSISLRKREKSAIDNTQIEVLKMKLKNMEEFQAETVKHYERELELKQKTIFQLTQANREFEKLCLMSVSNQNSGDMIRLRNENAQLKEKVENLENMVSLLQKEKDDMREIMVRFCITDQ